MARILDIADGYESSVAPTIGTIAATQLKPYVDDAAYVTAKGSAAAAADMYFNTTLDLVRAYDGAAWYSMPDDADVVHDTGNETIAGDKTFSNDVIVSGDLTVNGTQTILNTETLEVEDANILINNGGNDVSAEGAGLTVERTGTDGKIIYADSATSKFKLGASGSEKEVATISDVQVITNKDVDGGTASNTSRITLPKADTSTLDGLTRKEGTLVYDTTLDKVKYDDGANLKAVGSGSGGGTVINYLDSKTISDWTAYDDGAEVPVDLTGGSPAGLTAANETTTPLFNGPSWKFSKDNVNRQGMGWSTTMAIKTGSLGLMHSLMNLHYITSADYADNDVTLYLYNVDQSQLVYFTPYQIKASTIPTKMFPSAQAQLLYNATLSSADDYRLGIHIASANASAWDLTILGSDEGLIFGPTQYAFGSVVTDWKDFTPTGSWSTNTTYTGSWKRVGDTAYYDIKVSLSGAPNSATLSVNLPTGHVIDTTKIKNTTANVDSSMGHSTIWDASGAVISGAVGYSTTTSVQPRYFRVDAVPSYSTAISEVGPITFATGDFVHLTFSAPIVGWSSSTQMSDDADTRVVAARLTRGADQSITSGSFQQVQFSSITYDTHGKATIGATANYIIPISGYYSFSGSGFCNGDTNFNGTTEYVEFSAYVDGSSNLTLARWVPPNGAALTANAISGIRYLNAGQVVSLWAVQTSGNNQNIQASFEITKISGPSAIAASEKVFEEYDEASGQTIASGATTIVQFDDKINSSHGYVTTGAAWKFTSQRSDVYQVNTLVDGSGAAGTWDEGETVVLRLYKNGALYRILDLIEADASPSSATEQVLKGSIPIKLNAGDYIDIRVSNNTGSDWVIASVATVCWITISSQGGV